MARRIAFALAGGMLLALLWTTAALAAQVDRTRYPTSGFEIALMAIGVVVLIAIGFLLRYLARPKKPRGETVQGEPHDDGTPEDTPPGDEG